MVCLFVLLKIFPNNLVIALFTTLQAVQSGAAIKASAEWWPRWWQWLSLEQISSLLPPLITPRPDYCAAQCCSVICHTVQIPLPSHLLLLLTIVLLLLLKASTIVLRLLLACWSFSQLCCFGQLFGYTALPNLNPFLCLLHLSSPLSLLQLVKHPAGHLHLLI